MSSIRISPPVAILMVFLGLPFLFLVAQAATVTRVPFVYYLQHLDKERLIAINPEVAVVDPHDSRLTKADIQELQRQYQMTVIAYLSVGEVDPSRKEDYDGYAYNPEWDHATWLVNVPKEASENKMWSTRRVEYWDPAWQEILLSRVTHAMDEGYDGVMLDTVDSYITLVPLYKDRDVRQEMANLVGKIRDTIRARDNRFQLITNGAMELYDTTYQTTGEPYLSLIDGQLKEDTWYNEKGPIVAEWTAFDLDYLKRAVEAGKKVYSIDYFTNDEVETPNRYHMQDYFKKAREFGMIPFAADRSLGKFLAENRKIPAASQLTSIK